MAIPKTITSKLPGKPSYSTGKGSMYQGNSLEYLHAMPDNSVDLVVTSPPFALVRKKDYGNQSAQEYVTWFVKFAVEVHRVLKDKGSFVIDIGGSWKKGSPVRSTYHYQLLIELTRPGLFELAQDFFWYSPSKLPSPAEWVTVRKIRCKDAINPIWWLSKTPYPKASNERISMEYSQAMRDLLKNGYKAKKRPSGHDISTKFANDRGGAIPPNLLVVSHTSSNDYYQRRCREVGIPVHPARFPPDIPHFFIAMLTDPGDVVVDIFGGSNVTGWVCEHFGRNWLTFDLEADYVRGSRFRFETECPPPTLEFIGPSEATQFRPIKVKEGPEKLTTGRTRQKKAAKKVTTNKQSKRAKRTKSKE
ncbi:MAG: site-specific DNA-methyltransferase [Phycisphaerae bacterium]|nr:site-specific DNA-methyltransferase [Phycisphaerae bacterium]